MTDYRSSTFAATYEDPNCPRLSRRCGEEIDLVGARCLYRPQLAYDHSRA
jgi:hypothetical protein